MNEIINRKKMNQMEDDLGKLFERFRVRDEQIADLKEEIEFKNIKLYDYDDLMERLQERDEEIAVETMERVQLINQNKEEKQTIYRLGHEIAEKNERLHEYNERIARVAKVKSGSGKFNAKLEEISIVVLLVIFFAVVIIGNLFILSRYYQEKRSVYSLLKGYALSLFWRQKEVPMSMLVHHLFGQINGSLMVKWLISVCSVYLVHILWNRHYRMPKIPTLKVKSNNVEDKRYMQPAAGRLFHGFAD